MSFQTFDLHPKILKAIEESGYEEPTKIQNKAIPKILKGFDLRASAQTGTGKSAAFILPILQRLISPAENSGKGPRALILVPTRELAMQLAVQAEKYSKNLHRMRVSCVYGGVPIHRQMRQIVRPCDILVATPGRLIDFISRKKITFNRLEVLVLDEADRMLDMGFLEPVEQIASLLPKGRQTLLFTATLQKNIVKLSEKLLDKPIDLNIEPEKQEKKNIQEVIHYVDDINYKNRLLDHILREEGVNYSIVFTSTKRQADQLARDLETKGHQVAPLHGDMNQRQRTRTVAKLREGKIQTLVATDVAARGIDVEQITHVINFDLPMNTEDYVHRIGRTGRAGRKGVALSFVAGRDRSMLKQIEKYTGNQIDIGKIAGFEPRLDKGSSERGGQRNKRFQGGNKRFDRFKPKKGFGRKRR